MALSWLPADHTAVCFIDSAPGKQGTLLGGLPVVSLGQALEEEPDEILIAVLNREACQQIHEDLRQAGFSGTVTEITVFRDHQDVRLSMLRLLKSQIERRGVAGAVAELGVYRGAFAAEINRLFPDRPLYLFDTFSGFDVNDIAAEDERTAGDPHAGGRNFSDTGVDLVRSFLPHPEMAVFVAGHFPESIDGYTESTGKEGLERGMEDGAGKDPARASYALVSLDPDLYRPAAEGLHFFWDRLSPGGVILIHDYTSLQYPGICRAVDEFCGAKGLTVIPLPDLHGTAVLLKQS